MHWKMTVKLYKFVDIGLAQVWANVLTQGSQKVLKFDKRAGSGADSPKYLEGNSKGNNKVLSIYL